MSTNKYEKVCTSTFMLHARLLFHTFFLRTVGKDTKIKGEKGTARNEQVTRREV